MEGREKVRERNMDMWGNHRFVVSLTAPTRDLAHNLGTCPDWKSCHHPFGLWNDVQDAEPHQSGPNSYHLFENDFQDILSDPFHMYIIFTFLSRFWHNFSHLDLGKHSTSCSLMHCVFQESPSHTRDSVTVTHVWAENQETTCSLSTFPEMGLVAPTWATDFCWMPEQAVLIHNHVSQKPMWK